MKRFGIALVVASVMTFGLFFLMESLVSMGQAAITKPPVQAPIEFIRLNEQSDLNLKKRQLPNKEKPKTRPEQPDLDIDDVSQDATNTLTVQRPQVDFNLGLKGGLALGSAPVDRDTVPIVQVEPMYPPRARQRKIEGWVLVEFSISNTGIVKNSKIVRAEPGTIFNRAALKAVNKWKYKPRIDNGVPVASHGIRKRFTFYLNNLKD